ncbi:MAG: glycosyl hydrolase family 25 [Ruminococcus sp.]|uniref:GH25 family lysozyme n=1 Tax=Ruminococcus sp. TaxID=41978 RepID=UPI0025FF2407|nr:GH25 family lysozyme [Ruminococcus sp.]MBR5681812.1 glycosyl hydrolase family 25 [Ruminococcus sp.]
MHMFKRIILCTLTGAALTAVAAAAAVFFSTARVNTAKYPVFGVDVSNYQGDIDWKQLESQNVSFAFIKATEGSGHTDESVRRNLERAASTGIKVSAYHFFSFDSAGETQADNFIAAVDKSEIDMPPVIDIEYYADKRRNKPSREETESILRPLLDRLGEYYGTKPIIYTTMPVYYRYIRGSFSDYPLWIRCVNCEPDILEWKFWQYSDKGKLAGYVGEEEHIDLNVYNGSLEDFNREFAVSAENKDISEGKAE